MTEMHTFVHRDTKSRTSSFEVAPVTPTITAAARGGSAAASRRRSSAVASHPLMTCRVRASQTGGSDSARVRLRHRHQYAHTRCCRLGIDPLTLGAIQIKTILLALQYTRVPAGGMLPACGHRAGSQRSRRAPRRTPPAHTRIERRFRVIQGTSAQVLPGYKMLGGEQGSRNQLGAILARCDQVTEVVARCCITNRCCTIENIAAVRWRL